MRRVGLIVLMVLIGLIGSIAFATDFSSSNFTSRDPVVDSFAGRSTSSSFTNIMAGGQSAVGQSSSTSFTIRAGFLYFTDTTSTNVTVTVNKNGAGTGTVTGGSGISCGSTCAVSVAAGTSITLTAAADTGSRFAGWSGGGCSGIGTCTITPSVSVTITATFNLTGGGGGTDATINFSGIAFPSGIVTLLQDSQIVATTTASAVDATFSMHLQHVLPGHYNFALYAIDLDCRQSAIISYALVVEASVTYNITGIFISPTIVLNKSMVKRGDTITALGYTAPRAVVGVFVDGFGVGKSSAALTLFGRYQIDFNSNLANPALRNPHTTYTQSFLMRGGGWVSATSTPASFTIGDQNVPVPTGSICGACTGRGDLNSDCHVNLVDFSIAAFWWLRPLSPEFSIIERDRLNGDGVINLTDFSIMAYYWTG